MLNVDESREQLVDRLQRAIDEASYIRFIASEEKEHIGLWADACRYHMEFYLEFVGTGLIIGEADPRYHGYVQLRDRIIPTSHHSDEGVRYGNLPWRVFQPIIAPAGAKITARAFMLRGPQKWNNNGQVECYAEHFLEMLLKD